MQPDNDFPAFRHPDALAVKATDKGLPPEPVNPDTQRPVRIPPRAPRRRTGSFRRFMTALLLILLLGGIVYAVYIVSIVAKVSSNPLALTGLASDASGRTNVLVLGVGDPGHAGEKLSDTVMLLSLDGQSDRAAQVSLPRDLRVNIPGYGFSKINTANSKGGVELAQQTVSNTLDVPINYYLTTNFTGLKNLVDAAGGIDVDVPEPGVYERSRVGELLRRLARQQEVLALLRPKLTDWRLAFQPTRLRLIAQAAQEGIKTDMGLVQLLTLAQRWQGGKEEPVKLVLSTAPGGYLRSDPSGSSDLLPIGGNFTAIQRAVRDIFETP